MFSKDITIVWGYGWSTIPSGICSQEDKLPESSTYDMVKRVNCSLNFDVAQDNTCFSMQDCIDKIIALAWLNINGYEEYPENRIVLHYGDDFNDVEEKLQEEGIEML
jgi:hypothetical protein